MPTAVLKPITSNQMEILGLLSDNWVESPEETLLEMIGSCFAAGDISHMADEVLIDNLRALLEVSKNRNKRLNL